MCIRDSLYTDQRDNFHLLYHVYNTNQERKQCVTSTVSAHVFSEDGFTWHTSPTQPYSTQVAVLDRTSGQVSAITVSTRERPKILFDKAGKMTHLFNGVCSAHACPDGPPTGCVDCKYANWDYNLIAPLTYHKQGSSPKKKKKKKKKKKNFALKLSLNNI
eukprot:TRINITY_DN19527_c0_g1_i3.p1 TRINITY_DN19527_c0_g1~~TRINITY_DN19527_c0_g1_i3.p1  ORF type:complete len:160 (+),score=29.22 TRINITY_DN19527_c0_g1_i3:97-576(+)